MLISINFKDILPGGVPVYQDAARGTWFSKSIFMGLKLNILPFAYNCFVKCLGKVLALLILIVLDASDKFSTEEKLTHMTNVGKNRK